MMKGCMEIAPAGSHMGFRSPIHWADRAGHVHTLEIHLEATWDRGLEKDAVAWLVVARRATDRWAMQRCWGCMAGRDSAASAQAPAETCASTTWRRRG